MTTALYIVSNSCCSGGQEVNEKSRAAAEIDRQRDDSTAEAGWEELITFVGTIFVK